MPGTRARKYAPGAATRAPSHPPPLRSPVIRPLLLSAGKVVAVALGHLPYIGATPLRSGVWVSSDAPGGKPADDPILWIYLAIAVVLVLLGGIFAGLTIALMGQDDVNLQVIHESGEGKEREHAGSVLRLLQRGKHWVLVTLLLSNVITNETLPIVLDRSLGGGWPAVLASTILIVIFGEIIPQSICVRHGLPIGAWCAPLVLGLMYVLGPIAYPTAKLLDRMLGKDHGTVYKKAGLKTLVTLHKTLGESASERLNEDEVTIISAVLDLKDKPVGSIMTPMEDTFIMSGDTVLHEKMMDVILSAGYSRIPIHTPDNTQNFIGMLLVKTLITYDPAEAKRVSEFALATLPETRPETSCLDIVNFFQEGKSHMVLVSESPGENYGALGVVTLEDVIEELIGEYVPAAGHGADGTDAGGREIIDESDVFVDVHNAVRRKTPAPKIRFPRMPTMAGVDKGKMADERLIVGVGSQARGESHDGDDEHSRERDAGAKPDEDASRPLLGSVVAASTATGSSWVRPSTYRGSTGDLRDLAKHQLNPSNLASRPRQTRYNTVKIKHRLGGASMDSVDVPPGRPSDVPGRDEAASLLSVAGPDATDGARPATPPTQYGSISRSVDAAAPGERPPHAGSVVLRSSSSSNAPWRRGHALVDIELSAASAGHGSRPDRGSGSGHSSQSPVDGGPAAGRPKSKSLVVGVRSGSITENIIEAAGGFRKVILETTSSSDDTVATKTDDGRRSRSMVFNVRSYDGAADEEGDGAGEAGEVGGTGEADDGVDGVGGVRVGGGGAAGPTSKRRKGRRRQKRSRPAVPGRDEEGEEGGEQTPLLAKAKRYPAGDDLKE
ncbi:MAG: hypothetical protein M1826_004464 [Phylliscum demangeonii]|nr:MAG: hypothetical protein M1826_004464 [Phylliscum demangeonii]